MPQCKKTWNFFPFKFVSVLNEFELCHQLCKIARVDSIILDLISTASIILEIV